MGAYVACEDGGAVGPPLVHGYGGVSLRVHPSGLVSREGVDVAPEDSIGGIWGTRAAVEVVVDCFALPWWWKRWPIPFCRGGAGMEIDAIGDIMVPLCRGGLSG